MIAVLSVVSVQRGWGGIVVVENAAPDLGDGEVRAVEARIAGELARLVDPRRLRAQVVPPLPYLHKTLLDPADRERAVHLLRAVAFAYGRGLPWSIWPLVANAVADDRARYPAGEAPAYGNFDIAWLLSNRIGAYLVNDQEDDITVYRLFHDDLRTTLRERWRDLLEVPAI